MVFRIAKLAPIAIGAGFFSGFLETAVLALLPVYGLHNGIETAQTLILVSLFAVGSFVCQPFVAAVSCLVVPFLPFYLHLPLLIGSLIFAWGGAVGGYYTLGLLNVGQCSRGSDLTAASSMFVMAYTAGMVVGPLFCSAAMQVAGTWGLLILPAIVPALFIFLVLKWEGAGGKRHSSLYGNAKENSDDHQTA